ncbi:MAG: hypothetical protein HGA75_14540 [Thiobacillus sp.]|nr:hypothetical protein [Thiobacillus sp.]
MPNTLTVRFGNEQLQQIIEEAMIYMCACPAQVAKQVQLLRELYAYQRNCVGRGDPRLVEVHERIADSTRHAHAEMEQCLADVLELEGWDKTSLTMPEGLRELRRQFIDNDV